MGLILVSAVHGLLMSKFKKKSKKKAGQPFFIQIQLYTFYDRLT